MNTVATKRILVYGDSYTFGKIPGGQRYSVSERFTGVLQNMLGKDFEVIEEGLRGRMLSGKNKYFPFRNGLKQFGPIFGSHIPLDVLVLFLGANDTNNAPKSIDYETISADLNAYLDKVA